MTELEREIARLNEAVDAFAVVMKAKLAKKAKNHFRGWDAQEYRLALTDHIVAKGYEVRSDPTQAVDIANLAMMLWYQEQPPGVK